MKAANPTLKGRLRRNPPNWVPLKGQRITDKREEEIKKEKS